MSFAHSTPASVPRRRQAPTLPTVGQPPISTVETPSALQRSLAYLANGDLPPLPRLVRDAGLIFTTFAALCFVTAIIGGAL
jgi:hypothetical protein